MYHPGKILKLFHPKDKDIISADDNTHALVEMWDNHIFTVLVSSKISDKIKEGDIVIIDYYPVSPQLQIPKRVITKILRGQHSNILWNHYKDYQKNQAIQKDQAHEYMG